MDQGLRDLVEAEAAYRTFLHEHPEKRDYRRTRRIFWDAYWRNKEEYREALAWLNDLNRGAMAVRRARLSGARPTLVLE